MKLQSSSKLPVRASVLAGACMALALLSASGCDPAPDPEDPEDLAELELEAEPEEPAIDREAAASNLSAESDPQAIYCGSNPTCQQQCACDRFDCEFQCLPDPNDPYLCNDLCDGEYDVCIELCSY